MPKSKKADKAKRSWRLPRALRELDATPVGAFLDSDLGRRILADVLVAAAGAVAGALTR